jgi:hypothetical protein
MRFKLEYLAPLLVGAAFLLLNDVVRNHNPKPPTPPQSVVIVGTTPLPLPVVAAPTRPAPLVRIINLDVEPRVITQGGIATFINGICNDSKEALNVQIYLGAQLDGDPLISPTVDFVGKDTPEGRARRNLEPGCLGSEPITARIDDRLTPGKWRLHLVVMVTGESTPVVRSSPTFEVRSAQ